MGVRASREGASRDVPGAEKVSIDGLEMSNERIAVGDSRGGAVIGVAIKSAGRTADGRPFSVGLSSAGFAISVGITSGALKISGKVVGGISTNGSFWLVSGKACVRKVVGGVGETN